METFYKLAKPDGWDFYTGKTINYRENIGKKVKCPKFDKHGYLCSEAFIHASREPNQCFVGAHIPCSAYLVQGKPIKEETSKCGFQSLLVQEELNPVKLFEWKYEEACNPIHPFKLIPPEITEQHVLLVKQWDSVRASVRASVGDSVWASMGDSVRTSVWASVGASVRASVWDSMGDSVWASVWDSVGDSVGYSMRAYIGSIFTPCVTKWKHVEHKEGEYPFQSAVDLWKQGLVPSFDGKVWRLHGGENGRALWKGKI